MWMPGLLKVASPPTSRSAAVVDDLLHQLLRALIRACTHASVDLCSDTQWLGVQCLQRLFAKKCKMPVFNIFYYRFDSLKSFKFFLFFFESYLVVNKKILVEKIRDSGFDLNFKIMYRISCLVQISDLFWRLPFKDQNWSKV